MYWSKEINQLALPTLPPLSSQRPLPQAGWQREYLAYYDIDLERGHPGLQHFLGALPSMGEQIAVQIFRQPGATRTAVVLHGLYDHVGLFGNIIDYCLRHRCSVVAFDLPGHGLSSGVRASIDSFHQYRQVLLDVMAAARGFDLPGAWVGLGQSTGCAVLMTHLLDGGAADFDKTVLLAPLVKPRDWWWGQHAHTLLQHFIRDLPRHFAASSDDQAFLQFLRDRDPLQPRRLQIAWVGALKRWLPWFTAQPVCQAEVLVLQGDADATVNWQYNVPAIQKKFPRAQVKMIPDARHHLAKESEGYRRQLWTACDAFLWPEDVPEATGEAG